MRVLTWFELIFLFEIRGRRSPDSPCSRMLLAIISLCFCERQGLLVPDSHSFGNTLPKNVGCHPSELVYIWAMHSRSRIWELLSLKATDFLPAFLPKVKLPFLEIGFYFGGVSNIQLGCYFYHHKLCCEKVTYLEGHTRACESFYVLTPIILKFKTGERWMQVTSDWASEQFNVSSKVFRSGNHNAKKYFWRNSVSALKISIIFCPGFRRSDLVAAQRNCPLLVFRQSLGLGQGDGES